MKKKLLALFMSVTLISGLVGCGNSEKTESSNKMSSDRVKEATIEAWVPKGKQTDYLVNAIKQYNKEYGTSLKLETLDVSGGDAILEKLTPLLASGQEMPEITFLGDIEAPVVMSKFKDSFVDLTNTGYEETYKDKFFENKINLIKNASEDKHMRTMPHDIGGTLMYYRADLFEQVGIDAKAIKNWDELLEAGKKIKEKTGTKLITLEGAGDSFMFNMFLQQQGGTISNKNGEINIINPEAEKSLEYVKKIYDADLANLYASSDERNSKMYNSAVIIEGSWFNGNLKKNNPNLSGKWDVRQVPDFVQGKKNYIPVNGGSGWALGANSKQKDAAYQFMEYATTNKDTTGFALSVGSSTSNKEAYTTEFGTSGDDFYRGTKVWQEALKANENMAPINLSVAHWEILSNVTLQTGKVWKEGLDAKTALKSAADQASSTTGISIAK